MSQPPTTPDPPAEPSSIPPAPLTPPPPLEPPARRRWPIVVLAVVVVVAIIGGVSIVLVNRSSAGTFSAHGVSFSYPSSWLDLGKPTYQAQSGSTLWAEGFAPKPGNDIVSVTAYSINANVGAAGADQQQQLLDRVFTGLVSSQNGSITSAMHVTQLGGKPAFAVSFTLPGSTGDLITDDTIRIDGTTEYLITCQYHAATQSQISPGCQQVLSSFSSG